MEAVGSIGADILLNMVIVNFFTKLKNKLCVKAPKEQGEHGPVEIGEPRIL